MGMRGGVHDGILGYWYIPGWIILEYRVRNVANRADAS